MAGSFNRFSTDLAGLLEITADIRTATKLVFASPCLVSILDHQLNKSDLTHHRFFATPERKP